MLIVTQHGLMVPWANNVNHLVDATLKKKKKKDKQLTTTSSVSLFYKLEGCSSFSFGLSLNSWNEPLVDERFRLYHKTMKNQLHSTWKLKVCFCCSLNIKLRQMLQQHKSRTALLFQCTCGKRPYESRPCGLKQVQTCMPPLSAADKGMS